MFYYIDQLCTPSVPIFCMTCHLEDIWVVAFWLHCAVWYYGEWRGIQDASPSATKNTGVVLEPSSHAEACSYSCFWWCRYFWGPWLSCDIADDFLVRVAKVASRIGVSWTQSLPFHFLTQWTMAILWNACKPDKFESHNSIINQEKARFNRDEYNFSGINRDLSQVLS